MKNNQNSEQFYDSLADEYDEMTDLESRFSRETPIFQSLVKKYHIEKALDAGCGTGFHSVLLAQLGLQITATDISENMLHLTQKNAKRKKVQIEIIQASFDDLNKNVNKIYDAVFCLGNSLVHILKEKELLNSMENIYGILKSSGQLFIQMLNYNRILKNRERIQSVKNVNGKIFVRFYDFIDKKLLFNVLTIQKQESEMKHSLRSVEIFPWQSADIVRILLNAGYSKTQLFGSMSLNTYDELSSKDLVIVAQR
jgi:glycine/sarcosine N-methyltransferase